MNVKIISDNKNTKEKVRPWKIYLSSIFQSKCESACLILYL